MAMKKKIIITLGVLSTLLIVAVVWTTMNADKLVKMNKAALEKWLSNNTGTTVTLGELSTSIFPATKIIADKIEFKRSTNSEKGLSLDNLIFELNLLALFSGEIRIDKLILTAPKINLIKDDKGLLIENFGRLGKKQKKVKHGSKKATATQNKAEQKEIPSVLNFALKNFEIIGAELGFKDITNKKSFALSDVNVISSVKLSKGAVLLPLSSLSLALSDELDINAKLKDVKFASGEGLLSAPEMELNFLKTKFLASLKYSFKQKETALKVHNSRVSMNSVVKLLEVLNNEAPAFTMSGTISPTLELLHSPETLSVNGDVSIDNVAFKKGTISLNNLAAPVTLKTKNSLTKISSDAIKLVLSNTPLTASIDADFNMASFKLNKLKLNGFGGKALLTSDLSLKESKSFNLKLNANNLQIEDAWAAFKPSAPVKLSGTLNDFTLHCNGALGANLMNTLKGSAKLRLTDGELKAINLGGSALVATKQIPFLSEALYSSIPEEHQDEFKDEKTTIKSFDGRAVIGNNKITVNKAHLLSNLFSATGTGYLSFKGAINQNATITFTKGFSKLMAQKTKELKPLLNREEQIVIPLRIKGQVPKVKISPDVDKLVKKGAEKLIEDKAGKVLKDLFSF